MSVYIYDTAFVEDIRRITKDARISILPPDNQFRTLAAISGDKVLLPAISLQRTSWSLINERISHNMKHEGATYRYDKSEDMYRNLQVMPIRINYLIDIWTKNREENDNIARELIWYYSVHPTLKIAVPYSVNIEHNFNIFLDPDIEDNSDIVEHQNRGEYFRQTITAYTDDAYLWKSSSRHPAFVNADVIVIDKNEGVIDRNVKDN